MVPAGVPRHRSRRGSCGEGLGQDGVGHDAGEAVGFLEERAVAGGLEHDELLGRGLQEREPAGVHGRSLPLVLLAFRLVRTLHLVRWFLDRQRLVNTLLTAVPATPGPISIAGTPVAAVVPLVLNQGNTTAAFATARHAGRLTIAVATDPDTGLDGELLVQRLSRTLTELTCLPATNH
jgi:hypothetical protein